MDDDDVSPAFRTYREIHGSRETGAPMRAVASRYESPPYASAVSDGGGPSSVQEPGTKTASLERALAYAPASTGPAACPKDDPRTASQPRNSAHPHRRAGDWDYDAAEARRAHRIFSAYLQGQLSNVAKAAIWWSTLGVVAEALTGYTLAVGTTRLVFNLALVLLSPLAGTAAERANIRSLLCRTTWSRFTIWCILIPALWITCVPITPMPAIFYGGFLALMFLDGAQVSFANVVDIDCGGLDALAQQYRVATSAVVRDWFNRIHQIVFDLSFIVLTPPLAFGIWVIATRIQQSCVLPVPKDLLAAMQNWDKSKVSAAAPGGGPDVQMCGIDDVATLLGGICVTFGGLSLFSAWSYRRFKHEPTVADAAPSDSSTDVASTTAPDDVTQPENASWLSTTWERFQDVKEGFLIVLRERVLGWRLLFLALETALEDTVVSVIIPQTALRLTPLFLQQWRAKPSFNTSADPTFALPGGWALINLTAVCLIAIGKTGGLIAATCANARWTVPTSPIMKAPYLRLFRYMFVSCTALACLPVACYILQYPEKLAAVLAAWMSIDTAATLTLIGAVALIVAAFLIFFVFSAAPKIGFATLLHSLVLQRDVDTKVFGFVGTCVTLTDAVVILAINFIFAFFGLHQFLNALIVTAAVYALNGLCELCLAPRLILSGVPQQNTYVEDFPNLSRYGGGGGSGDDHHRFQSASSPRRSYSEGDPDDRLSPAPHNWMQSGGDGARGLRRTAAPMDALESLVPPPPTSANGSWQQYAAPSTRQLGSWADVPPVVV